MTPYQTLLTKYSTRMFDPARGNWQDQLPEQIVQQAPQIYQGMRQALPRGSSILKGLSHAEDAVNTMRLVGQLFQTPYYQATQEGGRPEELSRGHPGGFYDPYSG